MLLILLFNGSTYVLHWSCIVIFKKHNCFFLHFMYAKYINAHFVFISHTYLGYISPNKFEKKYNEKNNGYAELNYAYKLEGHYTELGPKC